MRQGSLATDLTLASKKIQKSEEELYTSPLPLLFFWGNLDILCRCIPSLICNQLIVDLEICCRCNYAGIFSLTHVVCVLILRSALSLLQMSRAGPSYVTHPKIRDHCCTVCLRNMSLCMTQKHWAGRPASCLVAGVSLCYGQHRLCRVTAAVIDFYLTNMKPLYFKISLLCFICKTEATLLQNAQIIQRQTSIFFYSLAFT